MSISLILEGGGTRGAYTAGVLDVLAENNIFCQTIYGERAMPFPIYQSRIKEIMRFLLNMPVTSVI